MAEINPLFERVRAALRPEYEAQRALGRGGMGAVFLALDTGLGREVAVKVLLPELATASAEEGFAREARNLARMNSPQVIKVHRGPQISDGLSYFVMEYVPDGTLEDRLTQGPLPPKEAHRLGVALLTGLQAIHAQHLVHRDLKPANVFLSANGGLIGDFGIALESLGVTTTTQLRAGTTLYMAPEQLAGAKADRRTDIYQMGAVLYEACTGKAWAMVDQRARRTWSSVPWRLRRALKRALAFEPEDRWVDATAFLQAWERGGVYRVAAGSAATVFATLLAVKLLVHPPVAPLRADLVILPLTGTGSGEARELPLYIHEPFERFRRLRVNRQDLASPYPEPLSPPVVAGLNTRYYLYGRLIGDTLMELAVNDSAHLLRRIRVPRGSRDLLTWARSAADSVVRRFFSTQYPDFQALAGCGGSDDAEAIREYLIGQEAFQRDAYAVSDQHFSRALAMDPSFVLAAWQRGLAHRWLRSLSWEELEALQSQSKGCSDTWYYRLLMAQLDTNLARRLAAYQAVIDAAPTLGVARLLRADDMFHRGALIGLPIDSAVAGMAGAIRADTAQDQAPALDHLIWGYVRMGRQREALAAVRARKRLAEEHSIGGQKGESQTRAALLGLAYDLRFRPLLGELELWWRARGSDPRLVRAFSEYAHLGTSFDLPAAQWRMGETLRRAGTDVTTHAEGFQAQGLALMAMARPVEALALFDSMAALTRTRTSALEAAEWRVLLPVLGLPAYPASIRDEGRRRLTELLDDSPLGDRAAWALAASAYAEGDTIAARRAAARIVVDADPAGAKLARLLAAIDSELTGKPAAALALTAPLVAWDPVVRMGDPFARAVLYLRRGRWLEEAGDLEAADRSLLWYENTDMDGWGVGDLQAAHVDAMLSGLGRIRRAALRRSLGAVTESCADLWRVLQLWRAPEPLFAALRDSVNRQLRECP